MPVLHNTDKDIIYDLPEMNPWCIKRGLKSISNPCFVDIMTYV